MNPINDEIIDETTKKFASDPEVVKRLLWWLRNGHSCERWFQFEWAYKLDSVLKDQYPDIYSVGCERDRIDIVIYKKPFNLELPPNQQDIQAGIELKWCGNWSAANSIAETQKDIENMRKDTKYNCPVIALSFWLFVTPSENNGPFHSWIAKEIKKGKVNGKTLKQILASPEYYDVDTGPYVIDCPPNFGKLEMFCIGTYNNKAKIQIMDRH